jgi:hypothetical protein
MTPAENKIIFAANMLDGTGAEHLTILSDGPEDAVFLEMVELIKENMESDDWQNLTGMIEVTTMTKNCLKIYVQIKSDCVEFNKIQ